MSTLPKNKFHEKQQQVYKYDWFCAIIQKNDRETDVYETYGRNEDRRTCHGIMYCNAWDLYCGPQRWKHFSSYGNSG